MILSNTRRIPNTALLFVLLAPITVFYYALYVYNPTHAGNINLYLLQVIADSIAIIIVSTLWITLILDMIQPEHNRRAISYDSTWLLEEKPKVDVLIPVSSEAISVIEATVKKATAMDYPHTTYILDDGGSLEVVEIAKKYGAIYVARPKESKQYAKAGNINFGLQHATGEFFAIFDADHAPKKEFLTDLLPCFKNENVALVQTPQHYTNTDKFIPSGTAQAQEIFYKYVQPAKNSYNAAFCVGTNMIYRRKAIDHIGGIASRDHSEDIWTTILLHEKGYESIYYNKVLAEGKAPETISTYFRQQNRWARGGFTLFFQKNPLFLEGLSLDQKLQYFFSNFHYFSGFAIFIYLILPIIYLLFGVYPMNLNASQQWFIHYVPFATTVYLLPLFLLQSVKLSTICTSLACFAPYIEAFFSVVLKQKYHWVATETTKKQSLPIITTIWPHILFLALGICAIFVGWYNPIDIPVTTASTIWVLINSFFLFQFLKNDGFSTQVST